MWLCSSGFDVPPASVATRYLMVATVGAIGEVSRERRTK